MLENASQQHGLNSKSMHPLWLWLAPVTFEGAKSTACWGVWIGSFAPSGLAAYVSLCIGSFGVSVLATLAGLLCDCLSCRAGIHAYYAAGSGALGYQHPFYFYAAGSGSSACWSSGPWYQGGYCGAQRQFQSTLQSVWALVVPWLWQSSGIDL